jgi:hypothetical protein
VAPLIWVGLFSADPAVLESARSRAPWRRSADAAANIALYFASQGAGRCCGRSSRAWLSSHRHRRRRRSLGGIFAVIAAAMAVSGLLTIWFADEDGHSKDEPWANRSRKRSPRGAPATFGAMADLTQRLLIDARAVRRPAVPTTCRRR